MSGSTSPHLGEMVRSFRFRAGLSQEALAEASGVSVRTISDLERGQRTNAHLETVRLLAKALDLTGDEQRQLLDGMRPAAGPAVPALSPLKPARWVSSLPVPATALIGRVQELDQLLTLLQAGTGSIVTLTGPGGVGKTRLAIEAGHRLAGSYTDGATFVPLVPVAHADQVPSAIAQAIQRSSSNSSGTQLSRLLAHRELLLILDNFEHVTEAALFVARLHADCPRLTILVTSRVRLRLSAERTFPVPPLALAERTDPFDRLRASDANQLFAERARRFDPDFELSERNAASVAEICRKVDGLPLAIELAASQLRLLLVPQLLDRLDRRLPLLTGGSLDHHPRQHSMRSTIAWSYDVLDTATQQFLRWMSLFGGGVSLESMEAIGHALGLDSDRSLEQVATLFDSGMLQRAETPGGASRFHLFETIREFGLEQLAADGELEAASRFHAEHFLAFARRAHVVPYNVDQAASVRQLDRLSSERTNLIQGFDFLCRPETAEQCMLFATPMAELWRTRGPYTEGQARIMRAIELAPAEPSVEKIHLLFWASYLVGMLPDRKTGLRIAQACVDTAEQAGSLADRAAALQTLAFIHEYHEEFDLARPLYQQIIPIWETLGNDLMQGLCLMLLGGIEFARGNGELAQTMEEQAVELFQNIDDSSNAAAALFYQGMFAAERGEWDVAAEKYDLSLQSWFRGDGDQTWFKALVGLADVAAAIGRVESSARFLGAVDQLLSELGTELMPFDRPAHERATGACIRALEPGRFALLKEEGSALSTEALLAESSEVVEAARASDQ